MLLEWMIVKKCVSNCFSLRSKEPLLSSNLWMCVLTFFSLFQFVWHVYRRVFVASLQRKIVKSGGLNREYPMTKCEKIFTFFHLLMDRRSFSENNIFRNSWEHYTTHLCRRQPLGKVEQMNRFGLDNNVWWWWEMRRICKPFFWTQQ